MKFNFDMSLKEIMTSIDDDGRLEICSNGSDDDPRAKCFWRVRVPGGLYEGEAIKSEKGGYDFAMRPRLFITWTK